MLRSVGVTGTNGKTTTTRWLAGALHRPVLSCTTLGDSLDDEALAREAGFEGFLKVTRVAIERGARLAAIELTSQALSQGAARAWPCEVGVFTNFTHDHALPTTQNAIGDTSSPARETSDTYVFVDREGDVYKSSEPLGPLQSLRQRPGVARRRVSTGKGSIFAITEADGRLLGSRDLGASWQSVDYAGTPRPWGKVTSITVDTNGDGLLVHLPKKQFVTHDDGVTWLPRRQSYFAGVGR